MYVILREASSEVLLPCVQEIHDNVLVKVHMSITAQQFRQI